MTYLPVDWSNHLTLTEEGFLVWIGANMDSGHQVIALSLEHSALNGVSLLNPSPQGSEVYAEEEVEML